ncbi:MAG: CAP domain-containing protein [Porcipelethomonas sp.]
MMKLKRTAALTAALTILFSNASGVCAQVLPDGSYTKGNQWYFSDDTEFDYTGIIKYDENGNPTGPTDTYSFIQESPAAIYESGVTDYMLTVVENGEEFPLQCKIGIKGDVNGDLKHDVFDSIAIARFSVGMYEISDDFIAFLGDINKDRTLDVFDSVSVAKLANKEAEELERKKREEYEALAKRVTELVNIERQKTGAAPVTLDSKLNKGANIRAKEISILWSHTRPDGTSCFTVLDNIGAVYTEAGENLAIGYKTPEEVVEGWMNSEGHRANILNPEHKKVGIGYYYNENTENVYHWSQFFTD